MSDPYRPEVYWSSHTLVAVFLRELLLGEIQGLNGIPRSGGLILAVNHASHFDPPIIGSPIRRNISFFARKTLWSSNLSSWWLDSVGAIPVDRDGDSDIAAMRATLKALKQGGLLCLFPEGTRSADGSLQAAKPGIGLIAAKSQATVVPCRIFNSHKVLPKGKTLPELDLSVHIHYGKALAPEDYDPGKGAAKQRFQLIADKIMGEISALKRPRSRAI